MLLINTMLIPENTIKNYQFKIQPNRDNAIYFETKNELSRLTWARQADPCSLHLNRAAMCMYEYILYVYIYMNKGIYIIYVYIYINTR